MVHRRVAVTFLAKILNVLPCRVGRNFDRAPGAKALAQWLHNRRNLLAPLVAQFVVALQAVEQFPDGDTLLLRANKCPAAMLLSRQFSESPLQETLSLAPALLGRLNLLAGADVPRNFPLFLAVSVIADPPIRAALALE